MCLWVGVESRSVLCLHPFDAALECVHREEEGVELTEMQKRKREEREYKANLKRKNPRVKMMR